MIFRAVFEAVIKMHQRINVAATIHDIRRLKEPLPAHWNRVSKPVVGDDLFSRKLEEKLKYLRKKITCDYFCPLIFEVTIVTKVITFISSSHFISFA